MKYHPDRAPEGKKQEYERKFKEINEAQEVLTDHKKRQLYDAYRKGGFDFGSVGWFWWAGFNFWWTSFDVGDLFGDLFWDFFGWINSNTRKRSYWPKRGSDILLNLKIDFKDVYTWTIKKIKYSRYKICSICNWSGLDSSSKIETCSTCKWTGYVVQTQRTPFGLFQSQSICPTCQGKWKIWETPCSWCNWKWVILQEEVIEVKIPKGVDSSTKLKFPGMWHYGYKWWTPGDLYVNILINEDSPWKKRGYDIIVEKEIYVIDAILWWTMEIELPDKKIKVKIPKWLQVWDNIVVSGQWFKKWEWFLSWKWDLIIKPIIKIPKVLSKKEKELYEKIRQLRNI